MDRAFASGASGTPPTAPASPSIGYPTKGNAGTGTPATKPGEYWYHMITEEMRAVIAAAGLTPSQSDLTQLLQALPGALASRPEMARSLATNGYQKLPSGLIIQWGSATINGDTSASITYPLAFPNSVLATFATLGASLNGTYEYGIGISPQAGSKTTATITVITNQPSVALGCNWLAIGY